MRRFLVALALFMFAAVTSLGCSGGVSEQAPPDSAPEMSAEKKKQMEDGIKKQKEMMKKHQRGNAPGPR